MLKHANLDETHRLESRMPEIGTSGSEGGEAGRTGLSYPYVLVRPRMTSLKFCRVGQRFRAYLPPKW